MLLQKVVEFVFEVGHWSSPALDSPAEHAPVDATPEAAVSTLASLASRVASEILITSISKINRRFAHHLGRLEHPDCLPNQALLCAIPSHCHSRCSYKLLKYAFCVRSASFQVRSRTRL